MVANGAASASLLQYWTSPTRGPDRPSSPSLPPSLSFSLPPLSLSLFYSFSFSMFLYPCLFIYLSLSHLFRPLPLTRPPFPPGRPRPRPPPPPPPPLYLPSVSHSVPLSSSLPLTALAYPFLSPAFIFLSSSRNPTTSSLHDLVVGWRPSLVLPTSYSSSACAGASLRLSSHEVEVGGGGGGGLSVTSLHQRRSVSLLLRSGVVWGGRLYILSLISNLRRSEATYGRGAGSLSVQTFNDSHFGKVRDCRCREKYLLNPPRQ